MRPLPLVALAALGCPWVGADEHAAQQAAFGGGVGGPDTGLTVTDSDTDADADTDTDTDADTDTDTAPDTGTPVGPCVDDGFEDDDDLDASTFVNSGASVNATLCAEDAPVGTPTDAFKLVVGAADVVSVAFDPDETDCGRLSASLELRGEQGELRGVARSDGACADLLAGGYGDGVVYVALVGDGARSFDYGLEFTVQSCVDADRDGFADVACGGPDCDDLEPSTYPGAPEVAGDGVDSDCDGGDALPTCDVVPSQASLVEHGQLGCGDLAVDPVWDVYTLNLAAGACVGLLVDNLGGRADPLAVLVDPQGNRLSLDDEALCTGDPWTRDLVFPFDQGCPQGGGTTLVSGLHTLWVAQVDGSGCVDGSGYGIDLWVDGIAQVPTPGGQGVVFAP